MAELVQLVQEAGGAERRQGEECLGRNGRACSAPVSVIRALLARAYT